MLFSIATSIKTIQYLPGDEKIIGLTKEGKCGTKPKKMPVFDTALEKIRVLFPAQAISDVQPLKGGFSGTSLYKVTLEKDISLVVRLIHNRSAEDKQREISAQLAASKNDYGPKVYATDEENGYIIMEFLSPGKNTLSHIKKLEGMGVLLRTMHQGEKLPTSQSIFDEIKYLYEQSREKLNKVYDCGHIERLLKEMDQYKITWKDDKKPTHRDCNPNNIIFSNQKLYLIDFENAAQDDPYFDLATIGIFQVFAGEHEKIFLENYFERKPTEIEKERYVFMRKIAFLYYALTMVRLTQLPEENYLVRKENIPLFFKLIQQINEKQFDLEKEENRFIFALSMLNQIK